MTPLPRPRAGKHGGGSRERFAPLSGRRAPGRVALGWPVPRQTGRAPAAVRGGRVSAPRAVSAGGLRPASLSEEGLGASERGGKSCYTSRNRKKSLSLCKVKFWYQSFRRLLAFNYTVPAPSLRCCLLQHGLETLTSCAASTALAPTASGRE